MNQELLRRLNQCTDLPSPPHIALRVLDATQDASLSTKDVVALIEKDPALATRLIRIVNSPYYGQTRLHKSVQDAVMMLGVRKTLNVALTFSLMASLTTRRSEGLDYGVFWKRALLSASYARAICAHLGHPDAEEAYLAALLQDVGMLALDQVQRNLYVKTTPKSGFHRLARQREEALAEADHATVGSWLLARWGFPHRIIQAVADSHRGIGDPNPGVEQDPFNACVGLSGVFADVWLESPWGEQLTHAFDAAFELLRLTGDTVVKLLSPMGKDVAMLEELFGSAVIKESDAAELEALARRVLREREPDPKP